MRALLPLFALMFQLSLAHAALDGEYTTQGSKGLTTLVLKTDGDKVIGYLRNGGVHHALQGRLKDGVVVAEVRLLGNRMYLEAAPMPQGTGLVVLLAAMQADGQPDAATENVYEFQRAGAGTGVATAPADGTRLQRILQGQAAAAAAGAAPAPGPADAGDGSELAPTPRDRQIAQFLLSGAWCHYSYTGGSLGGTEKNERVVFDAAGNIVSNSNAESSYSGGNRNQYGQQTQAWGAYGSQGGGQRGRWRVRQGMVQLSEDGIHWQPLPMQVTQNSNGYPIIQANGKEYARCN